MTRLLQYDQHKWSKSLFATAYGARSEGPMGKWLLTHLSSSARETAAAAAARCETQSWWVTWSFVSFQKRRGLTVLHGAGLLSWPLHARLPRTCKQRGVIQRLWFSDRCVSFFFFFLLIKMVNTYRTFRVLTVSQFVLQVRPVKWRQHNTT